MTEAASAVLVESTIADCTGITGGGLYAVDQANVTLKGGSRVERCTAVRGGGIQGFDGDVAILEGTVISECHARYGCGMHPGQLHTVPAPHASRGFACRARASEAGRIGLSLLGALGHGERSLGAAKPRSDHMAYRYLADSRGLMMQSKFFNCSGTRAVATRPPPCSRTAPRRPPWTIGRLGPRLRTPERRLRRVEARRGLRHQGPPQG